MRGLCVLPIKCDYRGLRYASPPVVESYLSDKTEQAIRKGWGGTPISTFALRTSALLFSSFDMVMRGMGKMWTMEMRTMEM